MTEQELPVFGSLPLTLVICNVDCNSRKRGCHSMQRKPLLLCSSYCITVQAILALLRALPYKGIEVQQGSFPVSTCSCTSELLNVR